LTNSEKVSTTRFEEDIEILMLSIFNNLHPLPEFAYGRIEKDNNLKIVSNRAKL